MDEFIIRAGAGGLAIAALAGPIGALMLWQRMTFFGAAVAHGSILGVALGLLLGINPMAGAFAVCLAMAALLFGLSLGGLHSKDTLVGAIGHGALAGALVLMVYLPGVRVDLMGYLFGDILAVQWPEIASTTLAAIGILAVVAFVWRPMVAAAAAPDIARAEGLPVNALSLGYALLLAGVVALGIRLVGALLIIALLVMPAATARPFAKSPLAMAVLGTGLAALSVIVGLALSFWLDWPAGPAITLAAGALFLASLARRQ